MNTSLFKPVQYDAYELKIMHTGNSMVNIYIHTRIILIS